MKQIFSPGANTFIRIGFLVVALLPITVPAALMLAVRTPYRTGKNIVQSQPIPFSHQHHSGELGIDCRYCHHSVEVSPFAGIPETTVCMTCHSQLWQHAKMLAPVRNSLAFNEPIRWNRVNNLPDYVYFDHSIHINKGIGCESCHGRVDKMPLMRQQHTFFMQFCLDCHRHPEKHLRPHDKITAMGWVPSDAQENIGHQLLVENGIHTEQLTECSICHR